MVWEGEYRDTMTDFITWSNLNHLRNKHFVPPGTKKCSLILGGGPNLIPSPFGELRWTERDTLKSTALAVSAEKLQQAQRAGRSLAAESCKDWSVSRDF